MNGPAQVADLLGMASVQRAGVALLFGSVGLPVIGVAIVGLDIIPVRFAMMHVALLGAAVGMLTGVDPALCGLIACAVAGLRSAHWHGHRRPCPARWVC